MIAAPRRHLFRTAGLWLAGGALLFSLRAAEPAPVSPATREITALLGAQAAAWNRGDLDGFMQAYAQTDELRFASGSTVTYRLAADPRALPAALSRQGRDGTLAYSDLVVTELAPDAALVFGRWQLTRAKDTPHGLFTLTLKKPAAGWRIIFDHTSSAN